MEEDFPREKNCTTVPSFVDTNVLVYAEETLLRRPERRPALWLARRREPFQAPVIAVERPLRDLSPKAEIH